MHSFLIRGSKISPESMQAKKLS